jgi:membrane associated rhomboid family serine protease
MLKEISNEIRSAFRSNRNGVIQLLVVNIGVFLLIGTAKVVNLFVPLLQVNGFVLDFLGLSPNLLSLLFHPWTLLTYAVVHLNIWHILFNMWGLYLFGQILQDFLGPRKILYFYLWGALAGGVLFVALMNLIPQGSMAAPFSNLHGASGAIYAIICGAAFLVPNYSLNLLLFGPVKLKYIAIGFVVLSFIQIPDGNAGGNIAHIGGALGGIAYLRYLQGAFRWKKTYHRPGPGPRPSARVVRMENNRKIVSKEEELNNLLDKISEKGIESLSREERIRLEQLSRHSNL